MLIGKNVYNDILHPNVATDGPSDLSSPSIEFPKLKKQVADRKFAASVLDKFLTCPLIDPGIWNEDKDDPEEAHLGKFLETYWHRTIESGSEDGGYLFLSVSQLSTAVAKDVKLVCELKKVDSAKFFVSNLSS